MKIMKTPWFLPLLLASLMGLPVTLFAAPNPDIVAIGKISAADSTSITVATPKIGDRTFTITDNTKVEMGLVGTAATVSDITVGWRARVYFDAATSTATKIILMAPKKKGGNQTAPQVEPRSGVK